MNERILHDKPLQSTIDLTFYLITLNVNTYLLTEDGGIKIYIRI